MPRKVYITGIGIISSIGCGLEAVLDSVVNSKSGIGEITQLDTIHKGILPIAEVKYSNEELTEMIGFPTEINLTRTALLGMIAAREAYISSGIGNASGLRTGLISATSVGGMDKSEHFYSEFYKDHTKGRLRQIINHECGESTERIARFLNIKHFVSTISTACSSSANSIMYAARLIKHGLLDRAVAGGTDAITRFTLNGFNSLMILDKNGCHPFDENRAGLTLGEGAGFLVLESEETAHMPGKKILAELTGYGNACDAYHQTASSPEGNGAWLAMKKALDLSGLRPDQIDYINVHGTGTSNNDLSEGTAIDRLFEGRVPPFSSTKSFTGHTLGAAGGVEAVLSILAIQKGIIYPNLNFTTPMKELNLVPVVNLLTGQTVRNVLSNSFGFGGNNSALIFSKI